MKLARLFSTLSVALVFGFYGQASLANVTIKTNVNIEGLEGSPPTENLIAVEFQQYYDERVQNHTIRVFTHHSDLEIVDSNIPEEDYSVKILKVGPMVRPFASSFNDFGKTFCENMTVPRNSTLLITGAVKVSKDPATKRYSVVNANLNCSVN